MSHTSIKRAAAAVMLAAGLLAPLAAQADEGAVKIGVLTDLSSGYSDISGKGSVEAARLAIEDFGRPVLGHPVELISADHQNRTDVALTMARTWYDRDGVDVIVDLTGSAIALGVHALALEKNKIDLVAGAASTELTGKSCSPNGSQWGADSYALVSAVKGIINTGGSSWYMLVQDAAVGKSYQKDLTALLAAQHIPLLGVSLFPIGNSDFSAQLMTAQASGAKVIASSSGGMDTINIIKQATEFALRSDGRELVPLSIFPTDIAAIGLQDAQGIRYAQTFYWDLNDQTRSLQRRFYERVGHTPTWIQLGTYSAVYHYLRAVEAAGTKQTAAVLAAMHKLPIHDPSTPEATLREDGRVMRPLYIVEVRKPADSHTPWDFERLISTIPAADSFRPLSESECPVDRRARLAN